MVMLLSLVALLCALGCMVLMYESIVIGKSLFVPGRFRWGKRAQKESILTLYSEIHAQLRSIRYKAPLLRNHLILDFYEQSLSSFEALLQATVSLFKMKEPVESSHLSSATSLAEHIKKRLIRLAKAVKTEINGKAIAVEDLYPEGAPPKLAGCYFCSKPTPASKFSKVKVKINDKNHKVHSCDTCRHELHLSRKIKVLYFNEDGQTVHWSNYRSFVPNKSYWHLNDSSIRKMDKHPLRLVKEEK